MLNSHFNNVWEHFLIVPQTNLKSQDKIRLAVRENAGKGIYIQNLTEASVANSVAVMEILNRVSLMKETLCLYTSLTEEASMCTIRLTN